MKIIKKLKLQNNLGLHIRPATYIVKLLQPRNSKVSFSYKTERANARSIMSLLMLLAKKNAEIIISVEGNDAKETMNDLKNAFEMQFGE